MDLTGIEAAMYLRKSRAEDGMDTAEILRRHRETLTEYAARNGIRIVETFQEIKSGESLYARPEMMRLLEAVESGCFRAVLCMDIDRLSRGETRERGIIWSTFKMSGTLIVTPSKVYDLTEESDELMTELRGLFANFELRQIKERTRRGMIRAAKEGCYIVPAPYGYRNTVIDKKPTLEVYEPEARFVRMAFELYMSGIGCDVIAHRLMEEGAHPKRAAAFSGKTILKMIKNPTYAGKVIYNRERWTRKNGELIITPRPESEWAQADGLHQAIIDTEHWEKCQEIIKSRWRPAHFNGDIKAPLAGIVRCRQCGNRMYRRVNNGRYHLYCRKHGCHCVSSKYELVEQAVITGLQDILAEFKTKPGEQSADVLSAAKSRLAAAKDALALENRKKARLYDLLESGTYTESVFLERMEALNKRVSALEDQERAALEDLESFSKKGKEEQAQEIASLLEAYENADAPAKNALLHGAVDVIWYDRKTRKAPFSLDIFLR